MTSEQADMAGRFLYERLGNQRFQELCAALLKFSRPDVKCYPIGQSDGGRDMVDEADQITIYQVKWTKKQPKNSVNWLEGAIRGEADNIRALVKAGAREYVLMTSVAGTASPGTGTMDRLDERLAVYSAAFAIPMRCEWRDEIDRRVESAPNELKWSYQEMLAGVEAVRYLIEADTVVAYDQDLRTLLLKVMETQWQDDEKIKFKQVELESHSLIDLFVDVEATRVTAPQRFDKNTFAKAASVTLGGASAYLLSTTHPLTIVQGAPGQGKSTLGQYLCQIHRAEFVPNDAYRSGRPPPVKAENPRVPIRVDLRDYGTWLAGGDPFADDSPSDTRRKERKRGSVEQFLAELLHVRSGGLPATVKNVQDVLFRFPTLIVFDGLDEVAQPSLRNRVVSEIDEFSARLGASLHAPQLIVTTRPNVSGMPEPSALIFEKIALSRMNAKLRTEYLRKWADAHSIQGKDRHDLERTFRQRSAEPHIEALVDNPMQLTILLYLIKKRGSSVPVARTELYTSYMETLLDREAAKTPAVDKFRKDLEEVTAYLGWYMQARVETAGDESWLAAKALRKVILRYLVDVEKETALVDALFIGVTDRVWALSSRVQDTFEFDVQPLREYFAARFLNEFAAADIPNFDKSVILRHLVRRAYWLNVARFFTGFANPNELAGLVEGLADELEEHSRPRQIRLAIWSILTDGVFRARTRTKRSAAALFGDDLSVRLLAHAIRTDPEIPMLSKDWGGYEVVELFQTQLADQPESPIALERVSIILKLQNQQDFDAWWQSNLREAAGGPQQSAWLRMGALVHAASRLDVHDIDKLDLSDDATLPGAFAAGIIPRRGSSLESRMIEAVVSGQCSDLQGASPGVPADLLKVVAAQHSLFRESSLGASDIIAVGHLDTSLSDHQHQVAMKRLIAYDDRFEQMQETLCFDRQQAGATLPWCNTAQALAAIYGPCWLAAEIAVLGAALPQYQYVTMQKFAGVSADPLGPSIDYGMFARDIRLNHDKVNWWNELFADHKDPLSRATWALALVAVASSEVVIANLGNLDDVATQLPKSMLHVLLTSSSRIGVAGPDYRLSDDVLTAAASLSPAASLLVAHHATGSVGDPLVQYSEFQLAEQGRYGTCAWPTLIALTARMAAKPSSSVLSNIRLFGASAVHPPYPPAVIGPGAEGLALDILNDSSEYPLAWVLAAEQRISDIANDAPLARVAMESGWFEQ